MQAALRLNIITSPQINLLLVWVLTLVFLLEVDGVEIQALTRPVLPVHSYQTGKSVFVRTWLQAMRDYRFETGDSFSHFTFHSSDLTLHSGRRLKTGSSAKL